MNDTDKRIQIKVIGGKCRLVFEGAASHSKDYIALYEHSGKGETQHLTWQYANKCPYDTEYTQKDSYEARYYRYDESTKSYKLEATTKPFPPIYDGVRFLYKAHLSWISLGYWDGQFVIGWDIPQRQSYDWIGLYKDPVNADSNYEAYYWIISERSPIMTGIQAREGFSIRFFSGTGRQTYMRIAATAPFPEVGTGSECTEYPRLPTSAERRTYTSLFPDLDGSAFRITDENTFFYNCIAWSLGFNNRWINPMSPLTKFIAQYEANGCVKLGTKASAASIDAWGKDVYNCTHGSRRYSEDRWESKLGSLARITHGRSELKGSTYGDILASLTGPGVFMKEMEQMPSPVLGEAERGKVVRLCEGVDEEIRERFEHWYGIWQYSIRDFGFAVCSDTREFRKASGYQDLLSMGPAILPLVVEKLLDESQFMALVLYEDLQQNDGLIAAYREDDPPALLLEGEQARAKRTIKRWAVGQE